MRSRFFHASLALFAAPALTLPATAQEPEEQVAMPPEIAESSRAEIDRLLADPELPGRLGALTEQMALILEAMPIGGLEAAIEGRPVTPEDQARTLGDEMDIDSRQLGDEVARAVEDNREVVGQGVDAVMASLPHLIVAMETLRAELDAIERRR